uniref:centromere protein K-like isoform X3 n=1 Tax=Oncorhynchus gorbuscha TaxID=8017 RepID=UPI001EAF0B65|nr:centromere protein K-like isoform X3 [Oncorhynchus gorbuscha]
MQKERMAVEVYLLTYGFPEGCPICGPFSCVFSSSKLQGSGPVPVKQYMLLVGLVKGKSFFQSALQKLNSQLELVLSCSQAKRDTLRETLKSEQKWLEEKKEVLRAGTELVVKQRLENERLSEHSVLQDTKKKIQKMKDYQNRLMETLADVLAEHFPLPTQETNADKKEKNIPQELNENLISLNEVLELLMNTTLETPHDPYVSIDETFWPPYTEMLLRHGIAQRHPEDCFKIRLETFY